MLDYTSNTCKPHREDTIRMDCMKNVVLKELSKPPVGSNTECAYYPCHHMGQECTFCYCPFYPCNDEEVGGKVVISRSGEPVWSCMNCHFMHSKGPAEYVHYQLNTVGIDDEIALRSLFDEAKRRFFYPSREYWEQLAERRDG